MTENRRRLGKALILVNIAGIVAGAIALALEGPQSGIIAFLLCFLGSLGLIYVAEEKKQSR